MRTITKVSGKKFVREEAIGDEGDSTPAGAQLESARLKPTQLGDV